MTCEVCVLCDMGVHVCVICVICVIRVIVDR